MAFHDATVKSLEELDEKLIDIKKKHWNGHDLPFPVLLDATKRTIRRWGIRAFPTMLLIDPQGRLAARGSLDLLKKALAGEFATPNAGR